MIELSAVSKPGKSCKNNTDMLSLKSCCGERVSKLIMRHRLSRHVATFAIIWASASGPTFAPYSLCFVLHKLARKMSQKCHKALRRSVTQLLRLCMHICLFKRFVLSSKACLLYLSYTGYIASFSWWGHLRWGEVSRWLTISHDIALSFSGSKKF